MPINVPGFWFMTWYDVSTGPNLAAYNFVRSTAKGNAANEQYAIIAPTLHCGYKRATENTIVGERSMGDARLDYDALTYAWFDHFLKGEDNGFLQKQPKVTYFTMGINKWQHSETWPPEGAKNVTLDLWSAGNANTLHGDGKLILSTSSAPSSLVQFTAQASETNLKTDLPDHFTYDPMHPTPSYGGNVCCAGNTIPGNGGALDQRKMEERSDILVYTSEPLKEGIELSGPITATLYVSSDVKDTDVTVKIIDVLPDGTAYNLDETIQRLRYRDGDNKTVWMEKDKVYKVTLTPMNTSNYFGAGDRIRIEIAGSNFPRFDRNLNTGGNNYDETNAIVAHTAIHHSAQYPSTLTISVVKHSVAAAAAIPKRIGGDVTPPILIYAAEPKFSEDERRANTTGKVLINLWVDAEGKPSHLRVLRGIGNELDEKAVAAVAQYKFKPAMQNGKPVVVELNVDVTFKRF
jgi:hypothetical protein